MNNRPTELNNFLENQSNDNDLNIAKALEKLELPENWKSLKPSVSTICKLTNLARNTVRNRKWALDRLKAIKKARKNPTASSDSSAEIDESKNSTILADQLRCRIKVLLQQNSALYQEVINLQEILNRKDNEIKALRSDKFRNT